METYETLVEAINALQKEGYVEDFNLTENSLACRGGTCHVMADEFEVDKFFRFEDNTNPSDQAVLYAISSGPHKLKGLLVNAYGIYSDGETNKIVERLNMSHAEGR